MISDAVLRELTTLRDAGELTPRDVLERARDTSSALHGHFEWDNSTAAHAYRLEQAKSLIVQAKVRVIPRADDAPRHIRAVVEPVTHDRPAAAPWVRMVPANDSARAQVQAPSPSPSQPRWAPFIAPSMPPPAPNDGDDDGGDGDDDDDDDDESDLAEVAAVIERRAFALSSRGHQAERGGDRLDEAAGATLLRQALAELVTIRRRYAHLTALSPVFTALDELAHAAVEPEQSRLHAATVFARSLMDRDGLDRQTAAVRAAEVHQVDRWELLEALRSRAAG